MHKEALIEGGELAAIGIADAVGGGEQDALFNGECFNDGAELLDASAADGGGFLLLGGGFFAGLAVGACGAGLWADGEGGAHNGLVRVFGFVIPR
jgi:hypothetical protein